MKLTVLGLCCALLLTACGRDADDPEVEHPDLAVFMDVVAQSETMLLYEGLPHQYHEAKLLKSELANKQWIGLFKFPFYRDTRPLSNKDFKALKQAIRDPRLLLTYEAEKRCGGFHPDYALVWQDASARKYTALICFGCGEIKFYGPKILLHYDFHGPLQGILDAYAFHRPQSKQSGIEPIPVELQPE